MKIGILTFHRALNCGAMLQAWALKTFLANAGYEVGFISNHVGVLSRWHSFPKSGSMLGRAKGTLLAVAKNIGSFACLDLAIKRFEAFQTKYLKEIELHDCDMVVVGSDQVWRSELTAGETPLFIGKNINGNLPMISYAASFGDRIPSDIEHLGKYVGRRYRALSVREPLVQEVLAPYIAGEIEVVADPTLLIEPKEYSRISSDVNLQEPYIFAYAVHATPFFVQTAKSAAKRLGLKLVMTAASQSTRWNAPSGLTYGVSPDRMIGYLRGSSCVVASSFHGTALSVLHGKPFVCLRPDGLNVKSRPVSLLKRLDDMRRVVSPQSENIDIDTMLNEPISENVTSRLTEFREFSINWLNRALTQED